MFTMTSRAASTISNRSIPRKPSAKPKPPHLRGNLLEGLEPDYMKDDLLKEDDDDDTSPLSYKYQDLPQQLGNSSQDVVSHRLVLAIDYGTTFTGVYASYPNACCSSLTVLSRGCFRFHKTLRSKNGRHQRHRHLGQEYEQQP